MAVVKSRPRTAKKPAESATLPKDIPIDSVLRTREPRNYRPSGLYAWRYDAIASARALQALGRFAEPARLARSLKTDAAVYSGLLNRLSPPRGLPRVVVGTPGCNAAIRLEAEMTFATRTSVAIPRSAIADNSECRAMHGLSVARLVWTPRDDGTRIDVRLVPWPIECVERDPGDRQLYALTKTGRELIVHGDGTWVVSQLHETEPETWGALMPLAMLWADRAFAVRDRSQNAESHGDDKWIGTLPEGVAMDSQLAEKLLDELEALYKRRRVMVKPFGVEVERDEATSQNWQIFKEIVASDDKDVQRILLGQDGTMTNTGGNYIKAWGLFGVRNDIVEGDLGADAESISTGVIRPWSIVNFGRWDRLEYGYLMPDADEDTRRESLAKRHDDFDRIVAQRRANKFIVDQAFCDRLARDLGIEAPMLAPLAPPPAPSPQSPQIP